MVPGYRFMHRKHQHFPLGTGLWFIKIDKVGSRTGAVSRARTVIRGSSVRRSHSRNGLNSVRFSRQSAKHPDEVGIYGLGHGLVAFKKIVGRFVVELRIRAKE